MTGYEIINQLEKVGYKLELRPGPKIELSLKQDYNPDPEETEKLINELKANKENIIDYLMLDDRAAFNKYIEELREVNQYDPRPDLEDDTELWQLVLKEAKKVGSQLYGNLHGYRCSGANLKRKGNNLKLITKHLIGNEWKNKQEWLKDREEYLLPYKEEITEIFQKVIDKKNNSS